MFDILFVFVYAIVLTTALRKTTGEGLYAIPALIFSVVAAIGTAIVIGMCSLGGILGISIGALIACSLLALAINKILRVETKKAWIVAASCTGFQFLFSLGMILLSPSIPTSGQ